MTVQRMPTAYAAPLVALDRVIRLDESGITTTKAVTGNEAFFDGHYPAHPVYPGVFVIEAVIQASRRYAEAYHRPARLAEVVTTRFLSPVQPGDVLTCDCACSLLGDGGTMQVQASCSTDAAPTAKVRLRFILGEEDA
jgi:3-hydroxyacyl-[acyl-carrier-protein] dehydratase